MGDGSDILATLTLEQGLEWTIAMVLCSVMVMITLPATITRIAMLNLDCFVVKTNEIRREQKTDLHNDSASLREDVARARKGHGPRTGTAICCGALGLIMASIVIVGILGGVLVGI